MADSEIAGLTEDTTPDSTDNVYVQDAAGAVDKRVPLSALPISTATQTALNLKANAANAALTGTPTAPTAAPGTNTTQVATTGFAQAAIAALINSAPGALDTLDELAAAFGDDANFAGTVTTALAGKVATTGNETIAGVKTFSSDPIIPDEAYNATNWNGVLEPPTKNAVRDQFETLPDISVENDVTLDVTDPLIALIGRTGLDVQPFVYTGAGQTWTKPANATIVIPICIGGGGQGASGRKGAAGSDRYGGGGGQGGMISWAILPASACGATETVTVGAGGSALGAAQTTNSTDGVTGSPGAATTFGSLVNAAGGNPGIQGLAASGYGGGNPWSLNASGAYIGVHNGQASKRSSSMNYGGGFSSTGATPTAAMGGGGVGSGGAGGGIGTSNTGRAGGNSSGSPGAGAATGGAVNTAGTAGTAGTGMAGGGGGSGGGASNAGGAAGAGGAGGAYGGGGGGGGAGVDSVSDSGAGGAGANGYCMVITIY